jgi:hypothetical protein
MSRLLEIPGLPERTGRDRVTLVSNTVITACDRLPADL